MTAPETTPPTAGAAAPDLASFRAQIDCIQIAEMLTEVKRTGSGQGVMLCPEHSERRPSCTVYTDHFHCYVCKAHGDAFKLVMLLRGLTFPEALDWVSEATGIARPQRSPEAEAAAATMRFFRKAFAEEIDPADELPFGLDLELARRLGLGRAHQLAALVAEAPRALFERDEVALWNGAWTLELHGRGGPLGFGAFVQARSPSHPPSASAAAPAVEPDVDAPSDDDLLEAGIEDFDPSEAAEADDLGAGLEDFDADGIPGLIDDEDGEPEAYGPELSTTSAITEASPEAPSPANGPATAGAASGADVPGDLVLGPFVKSQALRYPAFGGLGVARETIARNHVAIVTPDMGEMLELQAAGLAGVIGVPGAIDDATAKSLRELAKRLVLVTIPERVASPDFAPTLLRLARTGADVWLVTPAKLKAAADGSLEGTLGRVPLFSYLAEAAGRQLKAGDSDGAKTLMSSWLAVLPSASTRALYAAEATARGLPIRSRDGAGV